MPTSPLKGLFHASQRPTRAYARARILNNPIVGIALVLDMSFPGIRFVASLRIVVLQCGAVQQSFQEIAMAFVPVPNCAVAAMRGTLNSQAVVNTLWFQGSVPYTEALCLSLAQALQELWRDELKPVQVPTYSMTEIQVYAMDSATSPTATETVGEAGAGTGEAAANQAALVVTFRTGGRGRWSRGRNYLTGFSEAHLSNNAWTSTPLTAATDYFAALDTYVSGVNSSQHVVVSRVLNGIDRVTGLVQEVTSYEPQALPGTIRQRTGR